MPLNGYDTTALEAVEGYDLNGYNVIVTGGNSGIGVETVRALAKAGATVFLTSRNVENGQKVADEIKSSTNNNNVFVSIQSICDNLFLTKWPKHRLNNLLTNRSQIDQSFFHFPLINQSVYIVLGIRTWCP